MDNGVQNTKDVNDFLSDFPSPKSDEVVSISSDNKEDKLYIFFSLDICNSTKMKSDLKNWKDVVLKLYNSQLPFKNLQIWKFVGDEVIFCAPYQGISALIELIDIAYNKIDEVGKELTKIAAKPRYKIEVKGTLWFAYISKNDDETNIHIPAINDFLGKQIDEGFRISGFSSKGKLLLDPKIVFVLLMLHSIDATEISGRHNNRNLGQKILSSISDIIDKQDIKKLKSHLEDYDLREKILQRLEKISFINYENLKGVWNNSPYPIYWYSESNNYKYPQINKHEPLPILGYHNTGITVSKKYYSEDLFYIFKSVKIKEEIEKILRVIVENKPSDTLLKSGTTQLYYSIACVKDGKVLIAKRCFQRKHLSGVWEFGFRKHNDLGTDDNICNFFKDEFGINVVPITDGTKDKNVIPLHFCSTYRNNIKHNSILCCAEINEDKTIEELKEQINNHLSKIPQESSMYLYVDFVNEFDIVDKFEDFTLKEVEDDSYFAFIDVPQKYNNNSESEFGRQKAIVYFTDSVKYVLDFYKRWTLLKDKKWYNLLSETKSDQKREG